MEKKIISFKGISNVPDDGLNEAGDMSVLLNMRHKGGELVPCQKPNVENRGYPIKQALYHANSEHWLELKDDGTLYYRHKDSQQEEFLAEAVESFAIMGNIVIMNFADRVEYAIWEGDYRVLGALPEIEDSFSIRFLDEEELEKTNATFDLVGSTVSTIRGAKIGAINKLLDAIYEEGGFVDRVWFKIAFKLFDGTYIKSSKIIQASWYEETTQDYAPGVNNTTKKLWYLGENDVYHARVKYFRVKTELVESLFDRLKGWENVITSVDVFTTGSIMSFGLVRDVEGSVVRDNYRTLNQKEFYDAIVNANFYKMAEYSTNGKLRWEIENTSPSNLAVQTTLVETNQDLYIPNNSGVYNHLYHIYDFKKKLFNGYTLPTAVRGQGRNDTGISGEYSITVFIKTDDGEKVVEKQFELPSRYLNLEYYSYPDSRAYKMIITDDSINQYEIPLEPHPYRNEAFAIKVGYWQFQDEESIPVLFNPSKEIENKNYAVSNIENVKNVLKVSAVDNPFYFPTAQTYKFEGEIVGLASNAEAISPGQFGLFPLYVFTDTGIWAMQVDASGKGAYLSQAPSSREVCSGAICPVSGGVVFTTKRGVMAISGGQVTDLSAVLDGFEVDSFNYNAEMWNAIFAKAGKEEVVNPVPIREYIQGESGNVKGESGAKLAYNYLHNEVILSNVNYGYSYVYSLTNKVWSVIDVVFDLTTNKYPELVVFDKAQGKMFTFADGGSGVVPVVAITRPFTLGSFDLKRLRQAGLRTTFEGSLNFYLLGSNDGAEFKCITGKEAAEVKGENGEVKTYRDLITAMSRSKQYKYFAIAIAGNMSGRVSMAELLVDAGFAVNKLR